MTNPALDCDQIESALNTLGADIPASELHGTLCAIICADHTAVADTWYRPLIPVTDDHDLLQSQAKQSLQFLFNQTRQQLDDPTCDYQLMLPSDENDIDTRAIALGDWCQGFIMGLLECGIKDFRKLPENSAEVCQDFVEIARAGSGSLSEDPEEDEAALQELIEYVRVGVLLINEELHPDRKAPFVPPGHNIH